MATYRLCFFFDAGSGICFWADNDATRKQFGYPIAANSLSISETISQRVAQIIKWYDTSLDWNNPSGASPWTATEEVEFRAAAQDLLRTMREQLGPEFEIVDKSRTADPVVDQP